MSDERPHPLAVMDAVLPDLQWYLRHDRTSDSYPAGYLWLDDLKDDIRKRGGGGQVAAVLSLLFERGYIREPAGKTLTLEGEVVHIRDARGLHGCVEITGKVISTAAEVAAAEDLLKEALASPAPKSALPLPRFRCEASDRSVHLDGKRLHEGLDEQVFAYMVALTANYPKPVPFPTMQQQSLALEGANQSRLKLKIPVKLNQLIERIPNKGHVLKLPA